MPDVIARRTFLRRTGSAALAVMAVPLITSSRAAAQTERLVVALGQPDWEKLGIKVKRVPEATSSFGPKGRMRKTGKTFSVDGAPPFDEPVAGWERVLHSQGAFNLLLDGAYDLEIDTAMREMDADKRAKLSHDIGQKLWENHHGVMLGTRAITWATNKKVGPWQTLAYTVAETNYEYISAAG